MIWRYIAKHTLKILLLGLLCAVSIYVFVVLLGMRMYVPAVMPLIGSGLISYIFLSQKRYPLRWLVPGVIFLAVMVVYPIGYTFASSFTNVGTGHMLSKEQAIRQLLGRSYTPADAVAYSYAAFANDDGNLALLLESESATILYVDGNAEEMPLSDTRLIDEDGDGEIDRYEDYARLSFVQLAQRVSEIEDFRIEYAGTVIALIDLTTFKTRTPLYSYDEEAETMTDLRTGVRYTAELGIFTSPEGEEIYPGYKVWIGLSNYLDLLRNPAVSTPFGKVFLWTIAFATLTLLLNFAFGMATAVILNDPFLRFRTLYRVLMVVPYALPAFVTILIWRGLLNPGFGTINQVLVSLFGAGARVAWLSNPWLAKLSILLVNLWLGYPYMMIISLGALQSIPSSLYEAARVDGASWWQRFGKITLPLLLIPLGPLLVGSFAFNFNNFNLIWLLTEGRPPMLGTLTPAGETDILISYTYRLAFEGQRGNQLGLAAAVAVVIFIIIATISAINFRMTGALEELSKNV